MSDALQSYFGKLLEGFEPVLRLRSKDDLKAPSYQDHLKTFIWRLCKLLTPVNRERLAEALMTKDVDSLKQTKAQSAEALEDVRIARMIDQWQSVLSGDLSKDQRNFALSIMKKRGGDKWWPTQAQIGRMKQIWRLTHAED